MFVAAMVASLLAEDATVANSALVGLIVEAEDSLVWDMIVPLG